MKRRAFFGLITGFLAAVGLKLQVRPESRLCAEAPVRPLRIPNLEARLSTGESIYSGGRLPELLAEDAVFCDETISRQEEWMCREVLVNGSIP